MQRAGYADGDALFDAMLANPSGVTFTVDDYDETWKRLDTPDGKVHLVIPDLLEELVVTAERAFRRTREFPFVLSAGERRSSTANTIFRDPAWRKKDGRHLAADEPRRTPRGSASTTVDACAS